MKKAILVLILLLSLALSACTSGPLPVESWAKELPNAFTEPSTEPSVTDITTPAAR